MTTTDKNNSEKIFGKDYYLNDFSDKELLEILEKPYEWLLQERSVAFKFLNERVKKFSQKNVEQFKNNRLNELGLPEGTNWIWIIIGFVSVIFGGFLGILIGWFLWKLKKTIPDGRKVYIYNIRTRNLGMIMYYLGFVSLVFWI